MSNTCTFFVCAVFLFDVLRQLIPGVLLMPHDRSHGGPGMTSHHSALAGSYATPGAMIRPGHAGAAVGSHSSATIATIARELLDMRE